MPGQFRRFCVPDGAESGRRPKGFYISLYLLMVVLNSSQVLGGV